jgi:hypothetical protein
MNLLLLHVSPHWGGQFSTFEWLLVIAVIAITTVFLSSYAFWKKTNHQPILRGNQVLYENRTGLLTKFFLIYTLMAVGMALQIGGGKWDVTWHILQRPETFFTPPHTVLYAGVAVTVSAVGAGLYLKLRSKQKTNGNWLLSSSPGLSDPIFFAVVGSTMQIIAGIFDFSWHNAFGFDGLLSPPHALLVSGMVINSLAAAKGLNTILNQIQRSPTTRIIAIVTLALSLAVLWMCSVALMDLYTYPWSEGEHFNFNPDPQMAALGATIGYPLIGPFIALLALKVLPIKYPFTLVTGVYVAIIFLANILPDENLHGSIPYYALNVLVAFVIDHIYKAARFIHYDSKAKIIIIGSLIGPFFISMYFPGIMAIYQEPLRMAEEELRIEEAVFLPLIYQTELRIVLIPSILMGIAGSSLGARAGKMWLERTTLSRLQRENERPAS